MSLITSAAEAQAMLQQGNGTGSKITSQSSAFKDVLRYGVAGISEDMDSIFEEASARYGVPSSLIRAVAKAESNFNPKAVSHAGAMGVMQLMPGTARSLGVSDPYDARQNIMGGAKYLKENLEQFGDVSLALAAYNAGPGSVRKYGGIPPYKETQNYVKTVMSYMGESGLRAGRTVTTGTDRDRYKTMLYAMNMDAGSRISAMGDSDKGSSLLGGGSSSVSVLDTLYGGNITGSSLLSSQPWDNLSIRQEGDNIVMDKESFASMVQMMRIQMMMNADREVGAIL